MRNIEKQLRMFIKSKMRKRVLVLLCLILYSTSNYGQIHSKPKLFVGIIVDQMRAEYIARFYDQFGEGGFKRLLGEGFCCQNTHLNYIPAVTAVGHATIYSGTTPSHHGIIGNSWYSRSLRQNVYCVDDSTERTIGIDTIEKSVSPRNLLCTNLTDELKICTNMKSKVISISLKDRTAVLMAGHMADGAYWFDLNSGSFVTSTFYMKQLPEWVSGFNKEKRAFKYLENTWEPLLGEDGYPYSLTDDNHYEVVFKGKDKPVFPYDLKKLAALNPPYFDVLEKSPYGNNLLTDFAIAAIKSEKLGKNKVTDYLAISYSSTDAVGHTFGPLSKELNDTYLRLDKEIARLLTELDNTVGKGNYTLFLTADHGVAEVPDYLKDHHVNAGYMKIADLQKESAHFLDGRIGQGKWIISTKNQQFYLDRDLIRKKGLELSVVQALLADFLKEKEGVAKVYTASQLDQQEFSNDLSALVQNGFYYQRSGDVKIIYEPGYLDEEYGKSASSHGMAYAYDTHIPLIFYGAGVKKGESFIRYQMTDIAPTVSMLLHIKFPNACTGNPIPVVLSK
jgi:predicted AlkP superfamily pyrophosphatase or phosphodiesterase